MRHLTWSHRSHSHTIRYTRHKSTLQHEAHAIDTDASGRKVPLVQSPSPAPLEAGRGLLDGFPDAVLIADAAALLGYPRSELLTRRIPDLVASTPGWAGDEFATFLRDASWVGAFYLRRKDGSTVLAEARASPVSSPGGTVYLSVLRDLSDERRVDEQLREGARRLAQAQALARLGSWEWDVRTDAMRYSDAMYRILGITPTAFSTGFDGLLACVHPDDRVIVRETVDMALTTGEPFQVVHRIVCLDGDVRLLHARGEVVVDTNGQPLRVQGTGQDVTEQTRRDAERLALVRAEAARAEAEAALRHHDQFIAALAHDLRTPLTTAKGISQMLIRQAKRSASDDLRGIIEPMAATIDRSVGKMTALIEGLMDVARLQTGQPLDLDRTDVDLVAIVQSCITDHRVAAPQHHIVLDSTLDELVGVWDKQRLERMMDNLLSNAVKYSPEGGTVTVTVSREQETDAARDWAVAAVHDEGIGIPAHDLPHIFERFRRGTNVGHISGSGIGLAGVKQIVEQHDGSIVVDSEPRVGTTVTVRLPRSASGE